MKGWSEMEICNARIKSTKLRLDDVIPTFWEDLLGKYCWVKTDYQTVSVIGNIIKEDWFDLEDFFTRSSNGEITDTH